MSTVSSVTTAETHKAQAAAILQELQDQRAAVEREITQLSDEEALTAFNVHVNGADEARLRDWDRKRTAADIQLRRLNSSIAISASRLSNADALLNRAREVERAQEQMEIVERISVRAIKLDKLLAEFAIEFDLWRKDVIAAGFYGLGSLNAARRAIQSALVPIKMNTDSVMPSHRAKFADVSKHWRGEARGRANAAVNAATEAAEQKKSA